jgi:hypothetical protein
LQRQHPHVKHLVMYSIQALHLKFEASIIKKA